jgi:hypothetical protein
MDELDLGLGPPAAFDARVSKSSSSSRHDREVPNGRLEAWGRLVHQVGCAWSLCTPGSPYEGVNLLRDWSKKIADAAATMILYEH